MKTLFEKLRLDKIFTAESKPTGPVANYSIPQNYGSYALVDAARPGPERPYEPLLNFDFDRLISPYDLAVLRSAARKLMWNLGPARSAIIQKANYSFGKAWQPKFTGSDTEWGAQATDLLINAFFSVCDVRGPQFDFVTGLHMDCITMDTDGDLLILLTETEDGYPQFTRVMAHRISSGDDYEGLLKKGNYKGCRIWNGVIRNSDGRPVAYRIEAGADQGFADSEFLDVSAQDCIFVSDPDAADQIRGLPALTPAIQDLLDLKHTIGFEKLAAMLASTIGLIETNETGAPQGLPGLIAQAQQQAKPFPIPPGITSQTYAGGLIKHFRSNSGGKLEVLQSHRPSENWDRFMDRLVRNSCVAINWPYELSWDPSALSGTNSRLVIGQAMRSVSDRQELIKPYAKRMLGYAIAKFIKLGRLPESPDWYKWDFTLPPKLSVDYGRDKLADQGDWRTGITNMTDLLDEQGKDLETHLTRRAIEVAMRKIIAEKVGKQYGVEITADDMSIALPNGKPPEPTKPDADEATPPKNSAGSSQ